MRGYAFWFAMCQYLPVISMFDGESFGRSVARRLRIRFRRAMLLGLAGLPLLALGAWLLVSRGSPDHREIRNEWDGIGGLAAAVGLGMSSAAGIMLVTAVRWQRITRTSTWVRSRMVATPRWSLVSRGKLLVVLPDFHPDFVYSTVDSDWAGLTACTDVVVAGRRGSLLVVALGPSTLLTVRPPHTDSTRRRWLRRVIHPA
jgi:hypothetical protein